MRMLGCDCCGHIFDVGESYVQGLEPEGPPEPVPDILQDLAAAQGIQSHQHFKRYDICFRCWEGFLGIARDARIRRDVDRRREAGKIARQRLEQQMMRRFFGTGFIGGFEA
jgi:hypothetical protein